MIDEASADALLDALDDDPCFFQTDILGRRLLRQQRVLHRTLTSGEPDLRMNVRSGNGVGKTWWAGGAAVELMQTHPYSRTVCTGPSFEQVEAGLWQEIIKAHESAAVKLGGKMRDNSWSMAPGWDAAVINPKNISSAHGRRGQKVFVWIDEAQGVEDVEYWTALESLCQDPNSIMIAMGNPLWPQGRFFKNTSNPNWHNVKIAGADHPNVRTGTSLVPGAITLRWMDECALLWGKDHPRYIARCLGEFPAAGERQLIPLSHLEAQANKKPPVFEARRAGLDCARNAAGGDQNCAVILDEHRRVIHCEAWWSDDTMKTKGRFHDLLRRFNVHPRNAGIDVIGIGAGVVDRFREDGFEVIAVNFGRVWATHGWESLLGERAQHANLKAELFDVIRAMFRLGLIAVPKSHMTSLLWSDLVELRYDFNGAGKMKMEDKDDHRTRCGRSPDYADALACAMMPSVIWTPPSVEALRRLPV